MSVRHWPVIGILMIGTSALRAQTPLLIPGDRDASERYLPNRIARLKSKILADKVVNDPAFLQGAAAAPPEAAAEPVTA